MENRYIDPNDLRAKFRSKSDLCKRLSVDLDIFLPSYSRCSINFMKQLLAGEKKYIKNKSIIYFEIPDYPELAVKNVWPLVQENEDLLKFFPDYKPSQLPEKEFMYGILSTLKPDQVRTLIAQSLRCREPISQDSKDDMIEVTRELKEAITNLYSMKTTKGRANYLLKKSSILGTPRKPPNKYKADLSGILNYNASGDPDEEAKEFRDDRGEENME